MPLLANELGWAARAALRTARADVVAFGEKVAANKIVGPAFMELQKGLTPLRRVGVKGAYSSIKKAGELEARAANALERAFGARAVGAPWEAELYEQEARMLQDLASSAVHTAGAAAGALVKAPLTAAWTWLTPGRGAGRWTNWATRMGYTAGGLFAIGSGYRLLTGSGGPLSDQRGNFDIAGIPFV